MAGLGKWFEELPVRGKIIHPSKGTIDEKSNQIFCEITSNHHPLHSDIEYASNSQHGAIVIPGTYVLSLAVGLTVPEISGKAIANLGYSEIKHLAPTFVGDTINVETIIIEKRVSKTKPDRGIVKVKSNVFNQRGENVMQFQRSVLIPLEGFS